MTHPPRSALLALCLLTLTPPAQGEVFKWTDAEGRTHYGDKPPAGVKAKPVTAEITTVPAVKPSPAAPKTPPPPADPAPQPERPVTGAARQEIVDRCIKEGRDNCEAEANAAMAEAVKSGARREGN